MDVWRILIYLVAGTIALRSLVTLMTVHQHTYREAVLAEEKKLERELRRKLAAEQQEKSESSTKDAIQKVLAAAGSKPAGRG